MNDYNFGNFVCTLREKNGLTQAEIADKLGVTAAAVSKWENGSSKPRVEVLFKLAEILGVRPDELMAGHYIEENNSETYNIKIPRLSKKAMIVIIAAAVAFTFILATSIIVIVFAALESSKDTEEYRLGYEYLLESNKFAELGLSKDDIRFNSYRKNKTTNADGGLNQVGVGALEKGVATLSVGTSGAVRLTTDRPIIPETPGTWCYLSPKSWLSGAATNGCCNCIDWARTRLFPAGTSYEQAIEHMDRVWDFVTDNELLKVHSWYNINIPAEPKTIRFARQGGPYYSDDFVPVGNDLYQPHGKDIHEDSGNPELDTDSALNGYIAIMPLTIDRTDLAIFKQLSAVPV